MLLNRRPKSETADSRSGIDDAPLRPARVRTIGNSVRQFQGLELRALDAGPQKGRRLVAVASIDRLRSAAVKGPSGTLMSAPPSSFVLFVL